MEMKPSMITSRCVSVKPFGETSVVWIKTVRLSGRCDGQHHILDRSLRLRCCVCTTTAGWGRFLLQKPQGFPDPWVNSWRDLLAGALILYLDLWFYTSDQLTCNTGVTEGYSWVCCCFVLGKSNFFWLELLYLKIWQVWSVPAKGKGRINLESEYKML